MSSQGSPTNVYHNDGGAEMVLRTASDSSDFHLTNFTYDKMDGERLGDGLKQGSKPMGRSSKRMTNNLVNIAITKQEQRNSPSKILP